MDMVILNWVSYYRDVLFLLFNEGKSLVHSTGYLKGPLNIFV